MRISSKVRTYAIAVLIIMGLVQAAQAGDWPMYGHDPERSGASNEIVEPPLEPLWKYLARDSVDSSPSVSGDVVYFGSDDNYVYALDAKTGTLKWKYDTGNCVRYYGENPVYCFITSPAIYEGIVYIGSNNTAYALDAKTGGLKWKYKTDKSTYTSPVVTEGVVYIGNEDYYNKDNYMYALDAKTGNLKWKYKVGSSISSDPAVSDGTVYIGSQDKYVYALDAKTGNLKWEYSTDGSVKSPSISEGIVYVGSENTLYALEAKTGSLKWKYDFGEYFVRSPAIYEGTVYIGGKKENEYPYDNYLYALDAKTGNLNWKQEIDSYMLTPSVSASFIYVSSQYYLYALDAKTGSLKWKYEAYSRYPAVSGGIVYVGIGNYLYAFAPVNTPGAVLVSSSPSGASIYLDESYQGTTPKTLPDIQSGSYDISLKLKGYYNWSETITVVSGQISNVTGELELDTTSPPETPEFSYYSIIIIVIILVTGVLIYSIYRKKEYSAKMKKWEKEGYDVSELKDALDHKK